MPNNKGWLTKDEARATGLPLFIKTDSMQPGRWTSTPYDFAVLLTRTRCKELKMPTLSSGNESPSAYRYANAESSSYRYIPLYDRTEVFTAGELPLNILKDGETMGELARSASESTEPPSEAAADQGSP